jgi:hypothetical protein
MSVTASIIRAMTAVMMEVAGNLSDVGQFAANCTTKHPRRSILKLVTVRT